MVPLFTHTPWPPSPAIKPPVRAAARSLSPPSLPRQAWRAAGKRGLWLKVPLSKAQLVGPAAAPGPNAGFAFHHAEADYVMMTRWLPDDVTSTLPPNASHQVGVGAFVVNERNEVLVVQEAMGPLKGKQASGALVFTRGSRGRARKRAPGERGWRPRAPRAEKECLRGRERLDWACRGQPCWRAGARCC